MTVTSLEALTDAELTTRLLAARRDMDRAEAELEDATERRWQAYRVLESRGVLDLGALGRLERSAIRPGAPERQ
jgi:hypothetical protein